MAGTVIKSALLTIALVASAIWFAFFFLAALVMSTGFADTPGDTNGVKRFFMWFVVALPGLAGLILCAWASKRLAGGNSGHGPQGFPVTPKRPDESRRG